MKPANFSAIGIQNGIYHATNSTLRFLDADGVVVSREIPDLQTCKEVNACLVHEHFGVWIIHDITGCRVLDFADSSVIFTSKLTPNLMNNDEALINKC
jgi:hypothetical protein